MKGRREMISFRHHDRGRDPLTSAYLSLGEGADIVLVYPCPLTPPGCT